MVSSMWLNPFFIVHFVTYWSVSLACMVKDFNLTIDGSELEAKYNTTPDGKQHLINWKLYFYATGRSLAIQLFVLAPLVECFGYLYEWRGVSELLPLTKLVLSSFIVESLFYCGHRLCHYGTFRRFHVLHHQLVVPVAAATLYASVFENVFVNILPVLVTPLIVGMTTDMLYVWAFLSTFVATLAHSGFKCLSFFTEHHSLHHLRKNSNYSVGGIVDAFFGSYERS